LKLLILQAGPEPAHAQERTTLAEKRACWRKPEIFWGILYSLFLTFFAGLLRTTLRRHRANPVTESKLLSADTL
jgi:hypothetical protein